MEQYTTKVIKEMTLPEGTVIKEGTQVTVEYNDKIARTPVLIVKTSDNRKFYIRPSGAHKKLRGFRKPPSIKMLEKWSYDGVAKTIIGTRIEPDGYDRYGFPSWLIVEGII
jgi:hypothetical protein